MKVLFEINQVITKGLIETVKSDSDKECSEKLK